VRWACPCVRALPRLGSRLASLCARRSWALSFLRCKASTTDRLTGRSLIATPSLRGSARPERISVAGKSLSDSCCCTRRLFRFLLSISDSLWRCESVDERQILDTRLLIFLILCSSLSMATASNGRSCCACWFGGGITGAGGGGGARSGSGFHAMNVAGRAGRGKPTPDTHSAAPDSGGTGTGRSVLGESRYALCGLLCGGTLSVTPTSSKLSSPSVNKFSPGRRRRGGPGITNACGPSLRSSRVPTAARIGRATFWRARANSSGVDSGS
jgi:hypothetical protein